MIQPSEHNLVSIQLEKVLAKKSSIETQVDGYHLVLESDATSEKRYKEYNRLFSIKVAITIIAVIGGWFIPVIVVSFLCIIVWICMMIHLLLQCDKFFLKSALCFDFEFYYKTVNGCVTMIAYFIASDWKASRFWDTSHEKSMTFLYIICIFATIGNVLVVICVSVSDGYNLKRKYRVGSLLAVIIAHCYRLIAFKFLVHSDSAMNNVDLSYNNYNAIYLIDWQTICYSTGFNLIIFLLKQLYFIIKRPNQCSFTKIHVPIHVIPVSESITSLESIIMVNNNNYNMQLLNSHNDNDNYNLDNNDLSMAKAPSFESHRIDDVVKALYSEDHEYELIPRISFSQDDDENGSGNNNHNNNNNKNDVYVSVSQIDSLLYRMAIYVTKVLCWRDDNINSIKYKLMMLRICTTRWISHVSVVIVACHVFVCLKWRYNWVHSAAIQIIESLIALVCVMIIFSYINFDILKYQLKTSFTLYWRLFEFIILFIIAPVLINYDENTTYFNYIYNRSVLTKTWQAAIVCSINSVGVILVFTAISSIKGYPGAGYPKCTRWVRRMAVTCCALVALYAAVLCLKKSTSNANSQYRYINLIFLNVEINVTQSGANKCFDLFVWFVAQLVDECLGPNSLTIQGLSKKWQSNYR